MAKVELRCFDCSEPLGPCGDPIQTDKFGAIARGASQFADEADRTKVGVFHHQTRWVCQEVEDRSLLDRPTDSQTDRFEK